MIKGVRLEIISSSVTSVHPALDRIVRSKKILDVAMYPKVYFQSEDIKRHDQDYIATGQLELRGVKKNITFPFKAAAPIWKPDGKGALLAHGQWVINRKDFGVIWNKIFDHGGIIVGNHITIDWQIEAASSGKKREM